MNKLPDEVVDQWPEILSDITVSAIPVEYLHSVHLTFDDDKIWSIEISNTDDVENIETNLYNLFEDYNDVITKIDFRLDVDKIKTDVKKRTKHFMKKRR